MQSVVVYTKNCHSGAIWRSRDSGMKSALIGDSGNSRDFQLSGAALWVEYHHYSIGSNDYTREGKLYGSYYTKLPFQGFKSALTLKTYPQSLIINTFRGRYTLNLGLFCLITAPNIQNKSSDKQ